MTLRTFLRREQLLLAILLFSPTPFAASASGCEESSSVDWSDHDSTVDRLRELYRADNFAPLERALNCLLDSKRTFPTGKMGASAVYWMLRKELPAPGVNAGELKRIDAWKKQSPDSIFPFFAESRFTYAMAWNARGSNYASDVKDESWEAFRRGLADAEARLLKAPGELKDTPIWQNLMLAISQDSDVGSDPVAVFEQGVKRWPGYYDFYEVRLTRLVPKWGGSWYKVDQFIRAWSKKRAETEGLSLYARLYTSVLSPQVSPKDTLIEWQRMRASLTDLIKRFPTEEYRELAASYACVYEDTEYFKQHVKPGEGFKPATWLRGALFDQCGSWLARLS